MNSKAKGLAVLAGLGVAAAAGTVLATPAVGTTNVALVRAAYGESNTIVDSDINTVKLKMKGLTDVVVNNNRMAPGGTSGWHTHPGPTLISIKTGSLTIYDGDDPSCQPTVYSAGMGFVDEGGGHVHIARNEGAVEAEWFTTYLVPRGAATRIDAANPGHCSF